MARSGSWTIEPERPSLAGWDVESSIGLSSDARERRDFGGKVVCENGVVGDMTAFSAALEKVVVSSGKSLLFFVSGTACRAAVDAMYWSTHFEMMVSSNSPDASILKRSPAARANAILSLYS